MKKFWRRILGFTLAAGAVIAIEVVVIAILNSSSYRLMPKSIGWIILPVMAGVWGAVWADKQSGEAIARARSNISASLSKRIFISVSICWVVGLTAAILIFEPLGRYWGFYEWELMWKLLLVPPAILGFVLFVFQKMGLIKSPAQTTVLPIEPTKRKEEHLGWTLNELRAHKPAKEIDVEDFSKRLKQATDRALL